MIIKFVPTPINTTGTQSGVHSLLYNPWGISGATNFLLPDSVGSSPRGVGTSTKFTANKTIGLGHYNNDAMQGHRHPTSSPSSYNIYANGPTGAYPTIDGKWAGIYHDFPGYDAPPPTKQISFAKEVHLPLSIINNDGEIVQLKSSSPYFRVIGDKAYPLYGYSIEELFSIKKNGVLKWRGLFGKGNENWADTTIETEMIDIKIDSIK